jgi:hypothetical protein
VAEAQGGVDPYCRLNRSVGNPAIVSKGKRQTAKGKNSAFFFCLLLFAFCLD